MPPARRATPPEPGLGRMYQWTDRTRTAILLSRSDRTPQSAAGRTFRGARPTDPTVVVGLRRLLHRPRRDRPAAPRCRGRLPARLGRHRPAGRRRSRGRGQPPGRLSTRDRPSSRGGVVRPHPVRPVALDLARRDPERHRRRAGAGHRTPITSSSSAGGRTRGCSTRRSSAPARASPIRARCCRSPTSRTRSSRRASRTAPPSASPRWPRPDSRSPVGGERLAGGPDGPDRRGGPGDSASRRRFADGGCGRRRRRRRWAGPTPRRREGQLVADRIAARVRRVYGLRRTLAAPLTSDDGVVGAIVLSHRTGDAWSATTRRLLVGAADEASAALARAYSHRAAEARASTDALTGLPEPPLLRRVLRAAGAAPAVRGCGRRPDDRHRQVQGAQRHLRPRHRRRGPAGGGRGDRRGRPRGRCPGALRWRGVRRPAAQPGDGRRISRLASESARRSPSSISQRLGVPGVSVSVGVAVSEHADQPIGDLVELADQALYRAKRAGRNKVIAA